MQRGKTQVYSPKEATGGVHLRGGRGGWKKKVSGRGKKEKPYVRKKKGVKKIDGKRG